MTAAAHGAEAVGPVETAVHRLAPQCKVAALLAFVVAVALVPYGHAWPYAVDAALLAAVVVASRTPPALLARRLVVEIPFVAFVLVLPFVAQGPHVDVLGVGVARDGLWAAGGIAAKATLAVLATGVLAATISGTGVVARHAGGEHRRRGLRRDAARRHSPSRATPTPSTFTCGPCATREHQHEVQGSRNRRAAARRQGGVREGDDDR